MQGIGSVLKEYRNKLGFSLAEVHSKIGITDSRLSRIERGEGKFPVPNELKSLAHLYGVSTIELLTVAGDISEVDTELYERVFENADLLSADERDNIQTQINLFTKGRKRQL